MAIFDFRDYKAFVLSELKSRPKRGHGEFSKIARALGIHTTMVTHVFRGSAHLSPEQTLALADYFALGELETEYLVALVSMSRAGNERARRYFADKVQALVDRSLAVNKRLGIKNALEEADQAIFYSSWIYAGIRLMTAVGDGMTPIAIADALGLTLAQVNAAAQFLETRGLVSRDGAKLKYRELSTYLGRESPLIGRHHVNWRLKSLERMESLGPSEIAYTFPVMVAREDFVKVSQIIMNFIAEVRKVTEPSKSEDLCYFGVEWLTLSKKRE